MESNKRGESQTSEESCEIRSSLKPGDKVLLKKLDAWVILPDATMTVKQVGDFSALGVAYGALCEWINPKGSAHQKVYAVDEVVPI